ncbi:MAG: VPLPA-CTERM sorting domain-containing protein [Albidovulum sp.]
MGLKWYAGAVAGLALAAAGAAANAYVIDFTKASTGTTGTLFQGSVSWELSASGRLNHNQSFDGDTIPFADLALERDGYGVGKRDDKIGSNSEKKEWIKITFSAPVLIDAVYFLDLLIAEDGSSTEIGQASIDGSEVQVLAAATERARRRAAGGAEATFEPTYATSIVFTIGGSGEGAVDGALAGVGIAPVPVPAAGLMLIGGLGGLAALRRRRKAN